MKQIEHQATADAYVFVLQDPRDNTIRFVGTARACGVRLRDFIRCISADEMIEWIATLRVAGLKPRFAVVDWGSYSDMERSETYLRKWLGRVYPFCERNLASVEK